MGTPKIPANLFEAEPLPDIDFVPYDFAQLKDKVVYVVNVASEDDFTDSNYKMMANLLEKYHDRGLEILAFPNNWFGQKETRSFAEIKEFVASKYSDKIKVMMKSDVEWNQIFALGQKYYPGEIVWNFHGKFLFNRNGLPVGRFDLLSTAEYIEECVLTQLNGGYDDPGDPALLEGDEEYGDSLYEEGEEIEEDDMEITRMSEPEAFGEDEEGEEDQDDEEPEEEEDEDEPFDPERQEE